MCEICGFGTCPSRCPNSGLGEVMGVCVQCGEKLREEYEYYSDKENNKFCSEECAIEYNEIKSNWW